MVTNTMAVRGQFAKCKKKASNSSVIPESRRDSNRVLLPATTRDEFNIDTYHEI